ncbi:MAG: RHS repeat-associated core domain-containing protein [Pseudomonadota bacterium]
MVGATASPSNWSEIWITLPDGRDLSFVYWGGTFFQSYYTVTSSSVLTNWPRVGGIETLTLVGGNLQLKTNDDRTWTFNSSGQLITIAYRGGYTQTLTYSNGNNTAVTDNLGRSMSFAYDTSNRLTQVTAPDGSVYTYQYQTKFDISPVPPAVAALPPPLSNSVLVSVTKPGAGAPTLTYVYDDATTATVGGLTYTVNLFGLTGVIDERGVRYATFSYDGSGNIASSQLAGGVYNYSLSLNATTNQVTVTNPLGKQEVWTFSDDASNNRRLTGVQGNASPNCPASNATFTYDSNAFLASITDEEGRVTSYVNNAGGLPTSITRGAGTSSAVTVTYVWDANWRVPDRIVEPGLTTDYTWNAAGQLTQVTQTDTTSQTVPYATNGQTRTWTYTYGSAGQLLTVDGPLSGSGDTVTYTYNANGYLATVTNEVGQVTTITAVNGNGQPTSVTDPNAVVTNLAYDAVGRLTTVTVDPSGLSAVTTLTYNAAGDITQMTRPNGAYLQYAYDNARRLTQVQDNTGATLSYTRDNLGNVTARQIKDSGGTLQLSQTATYDELGRLLKFIGAANETWTQAYDKTDNRVSVTDPRSNIYRWGFDALNRLISETDEASNSVTLTRNGKDEITNYSDPRSLSTGYVRDGFGEVIQRSSPDSGTTVYHYSAAGKVIQITDGRGVVTNLTYDNAGRLLSKQYPAATAENVTYTWDATAGGNKGVGRVTMIQDASGSIAWTYNTLGQVVQEQKTTGSVVYTIGYAYDLDGNVAQITYPSGRIVSYSRDADGRIAGVTTKQTSTSAVVTLASGAAYAPFGPLTSLTYGNGLVLTKSFTQDYRLNTLQVQNASTVVVNRSHAFGDGINLTGITDNITSSRNESYIYTATNRLQEGDGIWGALTWGYDGVGNRSFEVLTSGGTTTTSTYNYPVGSNQLAKVTQGATTVRSFSYDGAGNITADNRTGTTYAYSYNNRGRLAELSIGATVTADYTYDGLERLAIRTTQNMTPAGTTHYLYDRVGRLLTEASSSGAIATEYVWLDDLPLAMVANVNTTTPNLYYVHADHLDRPLKMTDGSTAIVWDVVYQPFGAVQSISGTATNNLRFPGQYFLMEVGLHYNWHRHYDPTLGRYTQPDPVRDVLATQLVNLDESRLVVEDGASGGSKLDALVGLPGDSNKHIGTELPEFIDGSSIFSYAGSKPTLNIDPKGLAIGGPFSPVPSSVQCVAGDPCDTALVECWLINISPSVRTLCTQAHKMCLAHPGLWIVFPGFAVPPRGR